MHPKFFVISIIIFLLLIQSFTLFAQKLILGSTKKGICSFYADKFEGLPTSNGERYNSDAYTGAHRSLPFNTIVAVINLKTNKYVIVRINDRGPHRKTRLIDISKSAALELGIVKKGLAMVEIRILGFDNFQSLNAFDPEGMKADSLNN